jgi:hypothetical protein
MVAHLGLVEHSQEGDGSPYSEFCNRASKASYSIWFPKVGRCEQYVDLLLVAWGQEDGNDTYNSAGFEGFIAEALNANQLDQAAAFYAFGHDQLGWPLQLADNPGEAGLGWHGMGCPGRNGYRGDWGHCVCPGPTRRDQRRDWLARAQLFIDQGGSMAGLTADEHNWLEELVMAKRAVDAATDPEGVAMNDHWTVAWVWGYVKTLLDDTRAIKAKLGI